MKNKMKKKKLDQILNNNTLGSSELVQLLNNYFLSIHGNKSEISRAIRLAKIKLGHFEAVSSYLKDLSSELKTGHGLLNFLRSHSSQQKEQVEIIFKKISPRLKKLNRIITLSRSGTVLEILKLWHKTDSKIKVVACESRPKLEGRLMAESLVRNGIKTELITDAMMSLFFPQVDAAIIGADLVLKNGNVVNKVGSKSLALLCEEYRKPLYVITTKSKFSKEEIFQSKKENPQEIWEKQLKNLAISNIYFEEIEKKLITKIFTD
jgi:translation initiation factor eIF-2B subunit delta